MADRLIHQRTKGPASTPALRLVELQNALTVMERERDEAQADLKELAAHLERFHNVNGVSFGGIPAAQIWADFILWEHILNDAPELDAIFEIGTWRGGFAWWLWAQCQARDMYFETIDAVDPGRHIPAFFRADVFAQAELFGRRFRNWEPCVVFCDGGNKPRELATFANELRDPSSLLVVHDWGTEMLPDNVPDTVQMVYGEFCEEIGSMTRVFKLRMEGQDGVGA